VVDARGGPAALGGPVRQGPETKLPAVLWWPGAAAVGTMADGKVRNELFFINQHTLLKDAARRRRDHY
jgi:hypothetical protein